MADNIERNQETVEEEKSAKFISENPKSDTLRLQNAIKTHNFQLVSSILEKSPKLLIDLEDEVGKTPLHHLCSLGRSLEVGLSLHWKPDVNKVDKIGWTPLHYAAMKGYPEVSQLLVDAGADANKPDTQKGRTPLHLAVWRNHQDIAENLIHGGADSNMTDQDGKTVLDLCRNEFMKKRLEAAVLAKKNDDEVFKNEIGEILVETMEILEGKPTPFPNLGLTVQPLTPEDMKSQKESNMCFTMSIKKTPVDKVDDKFVLEETEDVCSDIFTIKTAHTNGPTNVDISLPIDAAPNTSEELVLKMDNGKELILTNLKEENKKSLCIVTIDVTTLDSFIIISRPKLEKFSVGTGATSLKSTVDGRVELNISKGTFDKPATITMEITETPKKEEWKKMMDQCSDIKSTTSFYSLDSGGRTLSKPVTVKVPLPITYSGEGSLLLFTMNDNPSKECQSSWKLMSEANNIKRGRIEFEASSFSVKVAVEVLSAIPDDMTQFGSSTSFGSIVSQVSRIFRKSRRREHPVTFVCMSRRVGTSNTFRIVLVCCKVDKKTANIAYWEGEGFESHETIKHLNGEPEVRARAKEQFKITSKAFDKAENDEHYLDFQPKLERSFKTLSLKIPTGENIRTENYEFFKVIKKENDANGEGENHEETEKVASAEVCLLAFNPKMMDKLDGRSFLTYRRMIELQKEIHDVWWKVLLLMDIPFKTIEKTLSDYSGSLEEKVNQLWFDWKEKNRGDRSRGIPILMSALCRCGKRLVVNEIQRQLYTWKNNPDNHTDSFFEWLITAYKFDLLIPTRYDRPMSDAFLAMLADRIKPSSELAAALSVPAGTVSDILANNRVYPTDGMKAMKIFDHFRVGMNKNAAALHKLVDGLRHMKLKDDADYVLMMTESWMKRQQTGEERVFSEVYEILTK